MKRITIALTLLLLLVSVTGISVADSEVETVKVGVYPNEPLLSYDEGQAKGFIVDLLSEIAKEEHWSIEYIPYSFDEGMQSVASSGLDMMIGVAYSDERAQQYDFNKTSLFVNWGQVYTNSLANVESLQDLQNARIGVMKGDIHYLGENGLKNTLKQFSITPNYIEYEGKSDMLEDLEAQSLDAIIINRTYGVQNANNYDVEKTSIQLNPVNMHVIFPPGKGTIYSERIDHYLDKWKADKNSFYYDRLSFWLGGSVSEKTPEWVWPLFSGGVALLLIAGLVIGVTQKIIKVQTAELKALNHDLEDKVKERTIDLDATNQHLRVSMLSLEEKQAELEEMNAILEEQVDVIERTQTKLIESEKMASLGRMVASMAHELNTPIGICVTLHSNMKVETLKVKTALENNGLAKSALCEYLEDQLSTQKMLENNIDSVVGLVERFKMLSNDRVHINERKINLHRYLNMQMEAMSPELKRSSHRYTIECPEELNIVVDPAALTQVIRNLTINSIVHGFEGKKKGNIDIQVRNNRERVFIEYADNGKGVDKDTRDKMFEPFFTTKRNSGGTGLGLSIVHSVVTKTMDGEIRVETPPHNGLKYEIELPLRNQETPTFSVNNRMTQTNTVNRSEKHESTS